MRRPGRAGGPRGHCILTAPWRTQALAVLCDQVTLMADLGDGASTPGGDNSVPGTSGSPGGYAAAGQAMAGLSARGHAARDSDSARLNAVNLAGPTVVAMAGRSRWLAGHPLLTALRTDEAAALPI